MLELIRSDIERYNKNSSHTLGAAVEAAYSHPSFIGVIWYRIGHALWKRRRNPLCFLGLILHRLIYPLVRIHSGLELGPRTQIGPGLYVAHFGPTVIHPDTVAGSNLTLMQGITIGADRRGVPHIGNNVSIGAGAKVIGGITVGDNAVVGAGAVVVKNVPEGYTVVGIPAHPIWQPEDSRPLDDMDIQGISSLN